MSDRLRVTRIIDLLANHQEEKISRAALARAVNTRRVPVYKSTLTRLWPEIQAELGRRDLFLGRPLGRLDYGVTASAEPLLALLSLENREKNVVTRLRNDVRSEVMQMIVARQGQGAVGAALQLERSRAYLDAYANNQVDFWAMFNESVRAYNALPWMTLTDADRIPYEIDG